MRRLAFLIGVLVILLLIANVGREVFGPKDGPKPPAYDPSAIRELALGPDEAEKPVREVAEDPVLGALSVVGVVLDKELGIPIKGVKVNAFTPDENLLSFDSRAEPNRSAITQTDGRFSLPWAMKSSEVVIVARHADYETETFKLPALIEEGQDPPVLVLQRGGKITGRVVAKGHGPLEGASVLAMGRGFRRHVLPNLKHLEFGPDVDAKRVYTNERGEFDISGLRRGGTYWLVVVTEGFAEEAPEAPRRASTGDHVELVVCPTGFLDFILVDAVDGSRILHAKRKWLLRSELLVPRESVPNTANYWFGGRQITHLAPLCGRIVEIVRLAKWPVGADAELEVGIEAYGYEPTVARVRIRRPWSGTAENLPPEEVALKPARKLGTLKVVMRDRLGNPVKGVRVRLPLKVGGSFATTAHGVPTEGGTLQIRLPEGEYSEWVSNGWSRNWRCDPVTVRSGEISTWELELLQAYVRFSLTDEDGNPLLEREQVQCRHDEGPGPVIYRNANGRLHGQLWPISAEEGFSQTFAQFGPIEPGVRTFEFLVPGYEPTQVTAVLPAGGLVALTVVLPRP